MKIAIFINTPAQVHFLKGIIQDLEKKGHQIVTLVRDHLDTLELLEGIDLDFTINYGFHDSKFGRIYSFPRLIFNSKKILKDFNPDLIFGCGIYSALSSALLGVPGIIFRNSPPYNFQYMVKERLIDMLSDVLIYPASSHYLRENQIKVNGFIEMNYLSPQYFTPNPDIFDLLNISKRKNYALVRFNSFEAIHDVKHKGFDREKKIELVNILKKYTKVFISAESGLPEDLKKHELKVPSHRIHDVMYYSKLFVTDTQTMTTEAAILGTPTIRSNSFVGEDDMKNFVELEEKFGLIFNYADANNAIKKAEELIKIENLKEEWKEKREELIREKTDIREFLLWFIENYPGSLSKAKSNTEINYDSM